MAKKSSLKNEEYFFYLLKRSAEQKNKELKITLQEAKKLRLKNCEDCGRNLSKTISLGIQLRDKKENYTLENCKRICGVCKLNNPYNKFNKLNYCKNALRLSFKKSPVAQLVYQKAKTDKGRYICNICKKDFTYKKTELDHINPISGLKEEVLTDMNVYIDRLWCDIKDLQILCKDDHNIKTKQENKIRNKYRKLLKRKT